MRIGSIGGSPIHIDVRFLILVAFFVLIDLERGRGLHHALLWIPILFLSVLVHELGHALTIRALGFGPSDIVLSGFGGLTINQRQARPWQDVLISLAGPLTSFLLAGVLLALATAVPLVRTDPMLQALVPLMLIANVVWGIFNLVPIYPLDGGHALHDLSRYVLSPASALRFSSGSSIVLACILLAVALIYREFFVVLIVGMLLIQNWGRWKSVGEL